MWTIAAAQFFMILLFILFLFNLTKRFLFSTIRRAVWRVLSINLHYVKLLSLLRALSHYYTLHVHPRLVAATPLDNKLVRGSMLKEEKFAQIFLVRHDIICQS